MARIFVVGSMNSDTFLKVENFVEPGETISALSSHTALGGKGLNQAVAAARMGIPVTMVAALGRDAVGDAVATDLAAEENLDMTAVLRVSEPTGQAMIQSDADGENAIVVVAGANAANTPENVVERLAAVQAGDIVVCQLEIPEPAVAAALAEAKKRGATTVLNAAPAAPVGHLLENVDVLIVNETEADTILGTKVTDRAQQLHLRYGGSIVVTLGSHGCQYIDAYLPDADVKADALPAHHVDVVDTTGAGDAFVGAFAAALAVGESLATAARWGTALGAIATGASGAQGYTASRADVVALAGVGAASGAGTEAAATEN
ncbi:ribokinase [Actinotignum sp. GS-2025b]|uniref:ribokinase n=1 Tax=Actinotignum sp. GS-2025b TaxID=3427275 RepID=UPI003F46697A